MSRYPRVSEHRVHFLFPFQVPDDADGQSALARLLGRRLSALAAAPGLPDAVRRHKDDPAGDRPAWLPSQGVLSEDLHAFVRRILSDPPGPDSGGGASGKHVATSWLGRPMHELSGEARNILNGRWGAKGPGLQLELTSSAMRRLGMPNGSSPVLVRITIEGATLHVMRSGLGIVAIELAYRAPAEMPDLAEIILETTHALSHLGRDGGLPLYWVERTGGPAEPASPAPPTSLSGLVQLLIGGQPGPGVDPEGASTGIRWLGDSRVFTYGAVQFEGPVEPAATMPEYAYRLCMKYTQDYDVSAVQIAHAVLSTFDNVLHGCSLEGGSLVVYSRPGHDVEFVRTYISKVVRQVYLPLAALSFHEFRYLIILAQGAAVFVPRVLSSPTILATLCVHHDLLVNFHLYFRFSYASFITHHNLVHQAWRRAFELDRLLREVTADVIEAEKVLGTRAESRNMQRWRKWSALGSALAVYLTLSHVLDVWLQMFHERHIRAATLRVFMNLSTVPEFEALQHAHLVSEFKLQIASVIVALLVAFFVYRFGPERGESTGKRH